MMLCCNPHAQYLAHKKEIDAAIRRVLDQGRYILGEEVSAFEHEFASYIGVSEGIAVGSGTEALHLALAACGIGTGSEVITVSHTAVATVAAIELAGAKPVFVDIDPDSFTLDPGKLEQAITPRTRAIIPVHLYGQPADLESILAIAGEHGLRVIEDCAQAHGAKCQGKRLGSLGDIGCFSFYPTKNLGAIGDGGMMVTDNPTLARQARLLREYGWAERASRSSVTPGWNSRLDEIQAGILRVKFCHLDADNLRRQELAKVYDRQLLKTSLVLPKQRPFATHVYHLYVVRSKRRDRLLEFLKGKRIGAMIHYPVPVHLQPAYKKRLSGNGLAETECAAREVLSLPMYPELTSRHAEVVSKAIHDFERNKND